MLNSILNFALTRWLLLALAASAALLAIAHGFETFGDLAPCHLCLQQRGFYWVAIGVCLAGLLADRVPAAARLRPWILALLGLVFLAGAAIAVRHAGAEWKWWAAPEGCSGVRLATAADLARVLQGGRLTGPRCDVAAWRWLGLSMAGWNALISLGLAGLSGFAAAGSRRL